MAFQNPLYTNTIMTNLPYFGSLSGPVVGPEQNAGNTTMGPIYPNMPKLMSLTTPLYTNKSLATFQQHLEESHHELVNMLTHQMVTLITPLLEQNSTRYEQLARQVNHIASIVDVVDEPVDQPRVRPRGNVENIDRGNVLPPPPENQILDNDIHFVNRGQNADQVLQRLRQNNVGGHQNLTRAVKQFLN